MSVSYGLDKNCAMDANYNSGMNYEMGESYVADRNCKTVLRMHLKPQTQQQQKVNIISLHPPDLCFSTIVHTQKSLVY